MLKRKIYDSLLKWKNNHKKECLLVKGARQVGKSFIIEQFGKENYKSFIELNFFLHPEYCNIFEGDLTPTEIYKKISYQVPSARYVEGSTLIFLDEIQHCPNARTAIKFLALDDRYDIISSGSLLGLHYKETISIPVGYESQLDMYGLDFEEFLWAYGYSNEMITDLKGYYTEKKAIPEVVDSKLSSILREYLAVGGMPEVVSKYLETNNFQVASKVQNKILREYEEDIKKYSKITERQKIRECYYSIPRQLAKEYTKFQYSVVAPRGSHGKYENSLDWLIDAGMIGIVPNVSLPVLPLAAYEKPHEFKVYGTDIGLTTALYGFDTQVALINDKLFGPAKGGIYENLIFDMLNKRGYKLRYIKKENNTQEIEFLIEQNCAVIPIEVKSKKGETKSLNEFIKEYAPPYAYKLTSTNVGVSDTKITLPHYLVIFI